MFNGGNSIFQTQIGCITRRQIGTVAALRNILDNPGSTLWTVDSFGTVRNPFGQKVGTIGFRGTINNSLFRPVGQVGVGTSV
jgi:hypothetical protein